MPIFIVPSQAQIGTLSQGASIHLAINGSVEIPALPKQSVIWQHLVGASASPGNICKGGAEPNAYGVSTGDSTQTFIVDQTAALECIVPLDEHKIGLKSASNNMRFGFQFLPLSSQANILISNGIVATVPCSPGQLARIEINGRTVTWTLNGTIVRQEIGAGNECLYRVYADLKTPGKCIGYVTIETQARNDVAPVDCAEWTASGGTISPTIWGNVEIVYTAPLTAGVQIVTVTIPGVGTRQIQIPVSGITLASTACGGQVVAGATVQFAGNGGIQATLTADGGTVIDSTTWLAPSVPGLYNLTYTLGNDSTTCIIEVVPKLAIQDVLNGTYDRLFSGLCHQFAANCLNPVYSSPDNERLIADGGSLSATGFFCAPNDADGVSFGAHIYEIHVNACGQTETFDLVLDPVFPVPIYEGPEPVKWGRSAAPKWPTRISDGDLLCKQYSLLGDNPELRWRMEYKSLPLCGLPTECDYGELPTRPIGTRIGRHHNATRLDEFWALTRGMAYPFWYRDRNGNLYSKIHFLSFEIDHSATDYDNGQIRRCELIASPCCEVIEIKNC